MMDLDEKIGIKENLIAEVGEQEAEMIWDRAKMILKEIEARYPNLPKGQQMHTGYIFPSAAVQLAVREIKGEQDLGYKVISEYSWAKSREMGARLRKTAKIPGFKKNRQGFSVIQLPRGIAPFLSIDMNKCLQTCVRRDVLYV